MTHSLSKTKWTKLKLCFYYRQDNNKLWHQRTPIIKSSNLVSALFNCYRTFSLETRKFKTLNSMCEDSQSGSNSQAAIQAGSIKCSNHAPKGSKSQVLLLNKRSSASSPPAFLISLLLLNRESW